MTDVFVRAYDAPPVREREVLRYAGMKERTPEVDALLERAVALSRDQLSFRVCYAVFPVRAQADQLDLGFARTASRSLRLNLRRCSRVVLFAATIGMAFDRLAARQALVSPALAQMLHALGAERVESLCDVFNAEVAARYVAHPRFSPGYGDLPLSLQKDIFAALDCSRRLGLTLHESMLMTPSKSVTALIGLETDRRLP